MQRMAMMHYSASIKRNLHHGGSYMLHKSSRLVREAHQEMQSTLTTGAQNARAIANRVEQTLVRLQRKPPLCFRICTSAYNNYGLKHVVLLLIFMFYTFFGALIFLLIEAPVQSKLRLQWEDKIAANRSDFVQRLMKELFNNSQFLVYIKGGTSTKMRQHMLMSFERYEKQLDIRWTEQKLEWDYWNAVIFAGTVCTTIGYGHIYPYTNAGKVLTMIYALGGIPLVLLLLQDLGKLLTAFMKYPWFQFKRCLRRMLRLFTKQSLAEIARIECEERTNLYVFDVPIPAAVTMVVIWLWICATVFCNLDKHWSLLEAFYFFFISLSTIGLGDLVPSSPHTLISMFGFIVFGLSLVSMVINLIQMKMLKTYDPSNQDERTPLLAASRTDEKPALATLGVIQCFDGLRHASEVLAESSIATEKSTRSAQTTISLPSARGSFFSNCSVHWVICDNSTNLNSPDDVTRLAGHTEELLMRDLGETNSEFDEMSMSLDNEGCGIRNDKMIASFTMDNIP